MKSWWEQVIFATGDFAYDWADVVLSAQARGDWAPFERDLRFKIACVKQLRSTHQYPSHDEVDVLARDFRLERDLASAEDMKAWLNRVGISSETWMRLVRRSLLAKKWAPRRTEIVAAHPVTCKDFYLRFRTEGLCFGVLARWAWRLAARAAAQQCVAEQGAEANAQAAAKPVSGKARSGRLPGLSFETCREKSSWLSRLETSYQWFCHQNLTEESLQRQIAVHAADWVRIDCDHASFASQSMAKEAALCVRSDGEDLDTVVSRARGVVHSTRFVLEELELDLRVPFLSASVGDLLGPLVWNDEFRLSLIRNKVQAALEDADIRRRAEHLVLRRALVPEIERRVEWKNEAMRDERVLLP